MAAGAEASATGKRTRRVAAGARRAVYALLFEDGSCYVGQSVDARKAVRALRQTWKDGPDPKAMILEEVGPSEDAAEVAQRWRRAAKRAGLGNRCWPFVLGYVGINHPMNEDDGDKAKAWPDFGGAPTVTISPADGVTRFDYGRGRDGGKGMQATRNMLTNGTTAPQDARPKPAPNGSHGPAAPTPPRPTIVYALAVIDPSPGKPRVLSIRKTTDTMDGTLALLRRGLAADNANPRTRFERKARDDGMGLIAFELETVTDPAEVGDRVHAWMRAAEQAAGCVLAGGPAPAGIAGRPATWGSAEAMRGGTVLLEPKAAVEAPEEKPAKKGRGREDEERWRITAERIVRQVARAAAEHDWQLMADALGKTRSLTTAQRAQGPKAAGELGARGARKAVDEMARHEVGRAVLAAITERDDASEQIDATFAALGRTPINRPATTGVGGVANGDTPTDDVAEADEDGLREGPRDPIVVAHAILTYAQAGAWHRQRPMVFTAVEGVARVHAQWQGKCLSQANPHAIHSDLDGPTAEMAMQELERHPMGCLLIQALARTRTTDSMTDYVIEHAEQAGLSKIQPPRRQP